MGRKPINKVRIENPEVRKKWILKLMPLMLEQGVRKFTMDEIASYLGVSKATIYKHFKSREVIVDELVEMKVTEVLEFAPMLQDRTVPFKERYENAVRQASLSLAGISGKFLADVKELFPDTWFKIESLRKTSTTLLKLFYEEGIENMILKDINPEILSITDRIMIDSLSNPDILKETNMTVSEAIEGYFQMKSKGIFLE